MTNTERIHDTKNPMECCDRCRTAELGRRVKRVPNINYTQTASTGEVAVLRGREVIATLRKDALFGWVINTTHPALVSIDQHDDDRRSCLQHIQTEYTAAWRKGEAS